MGVMISVVDSESSPFKADSYFPLLQLSRTEAERLGEINWELRNLVPMTLHVYTFGNKLNQH